MIRKKLLVGLTALLLIVGAVFVTNTLVGTKNASGADCDGNAVMYCGGYDAATIQSKYTGDIPALYNYFGITNDMVQNLGSAKAGYVTSDNRVVVDGRTVAVDVTTAGRQYMAGSTRVPVAGTFYERPPSVSFRSSQIAAFVILDAQGRFVAAIIKSCGNPVHGKNTVPTPTASCDSLTVTPTADRRTFTMTAQAALAGGAVSEGWHIDARDLTGAVVGALDFPGNNAAVTGTMTFADTVSGTITVKATMAAAPGLGLLSGPNCVKTITLQPQFGSAECRELTVTKVGVNTYNLKASLTQNGVISLTGTKFTVTDQTGKVVVSKTEKAKLETTVTVPAGGPYNVTAEPMILGNYTGTQNCKATIPADHVGTPGVAIDKKVDGVETKEVAVGAPYTYQLKVTNTGEVDLKNVAVRDPAPEGVQLLEADKGQVANNVWTYTIPELKVGQSVNFAIKAKVTVQKEGAIVNTACVNAPEVNPGEPTKDDDCDDATVTVPKPKTPGVSIDKKVDGVETKEVALNQEFTYQLVVKNTGAVDLKSVVVTDPAPSNVQFASTDKGSVDGNKLAYTIPELAIGQSVTINIRAKVTAQVTGNIKNTACVNAPEVNPGEPTKDDDCDDAYVYVPPVVIKNPNISIVKTVNDQKTTQVAVGAVFTYKLVVTNNGQVDMKNVVVTDKAPTGVTLVSAEQGTLSGNVWTYTIPELKVGESQTYTIRAKVMAYQAGAMINIACVNAPEVNPGEPTKDDACDEATVTVPTPPVTPPVTPPATTPQVLPNTGVGSVVGLFGLTSFVGALAYRLVLGRRLSRQ